MTTSGVRLFLPVALGMAMASVASAVVISDITVTTTTGTYTSPLNYGDYSGEGFFFIPNITSPSEDGIEIESVDDVIGQDSDSLVKFSYTVTADPGQLIYGAEVTPGLYLYDALGEIDISFGSVQSDFDYTDDGSGFGTTAGNYGVDLSPGYSSLTVSGEYYMSTIGSQNLWAEGYADHLEITFSQSSAPGPAGVIPFGAGSIGAFVRRRRTP